MWKDFFYFSLSERRAIYVLLVLIAVLIIAIIWTPTSGVQSVYDVAEADSPSTSGINKRLSSSMVNKYFDGIVPELDETKFDEFDTNKYKDGYYYNICYWRKCSCIRNSILNNIFNEYNSAGGIFEIDEIESIHTYKHWIDIIDAIAGGEIPESLVKIIMEADALLEEEENYYYIFEEEKNKKIVKN